MCLRHGAGGVKSPGLVVLRVGTRGRGCHLVKNVITLDHSVMNAFEADPLDLSQ